MSRSAHSTPRMHKKVARFADATEIGDEETPSRRRSTAASWPHKSNLPQVSEFQLLEGATRLSSKGGEPSPSSEKDIEDLCGLAFDDSSSDSDPLPEVAYESLQSEDADEPPSATASDDMAMSFASLLKHNDRIRSIRRHSSPPAVVTETPPARSRPSRSHSHASMPSSPPSWSLLARSRHKSGADVALTHVIVHAKSDASLASSGSSGTTRTSGSTRATGVSTQTTRSANGVFRVL